MQREETRVLIVDDEQVICQLFQHTLKKRGYFAETASDGQEALNLCKIEPYHIVITDLKMPRLDGISLLREIKANWPDTEVIVITGYATIESAIEAMKIGASDFILKPVNFESVYLIVEKCFTHLLQKIENAELRAENLRLQELNLLKDKFLSITNHEMRTPIMVFKGYLEILNFLNPEQTAEREEIEAILLKTSLEMEESVGRMHLLNGLRRKQWYNHNETIDIIANAAEIANDMKRLFEHRSIDLETILPEEPVKINGSLQGLRIVIRELLQNALKFTPDGGKVVVKGEKEKDFVKLIIRDNGIGIANDKLDLIFTDFYEVGDTFNHKTSKEEFLGGGLGIGLGLVREVVTGMDGTISVESIEGKGTDFIIRFPVFCVEKKLFLEPV
ncbi:MAG: response regulator [Calditrichota bacterium]